MKKLSILLLLTYVIIPLAGFCRIIYVPQETSRIQTAINISANGDTVLVRPGRYAEPLNFRGRNITLASLFLTTADTNYIKVTTIAGDSTSPVIRIENGEDSTAILEGFTITNGHGSNGGGVYCFIADPIIKYNIVEGNSAQNGAGIYLGYSQAKIQNNIIRNNISNSAGGGIRCFISNSKITGNIIWNNSALAGAGISCVNSDVEAKNNAFGNNFASGNYHAPSAVSLGYNSTGAFINNTIYRNRSVTGPAISCYDQSSASFRNCVIWGNSPADTSCDGTSTMELSYCDLSDGGEINGNINLDPMLVNPQRGYFNFCTLSPCIDAGDPNLLDPDSSRSDIGMYFSSHPECEYSVRRYVSTSGNDTSGNGSLQHPFRTIQYGVDMAKSGDSIIVQNGRYKENLDLFMKNIVLASEYIFTLDTLDIHNTIIDGDSIEPCISYTRCETLSVLKGFTIQFGYGEGITIDNSNLEIQNNIISDNILLGIALENSFLTIKGNKICRSRYDGISCDHGSNAKIYGNIIFDNNSGGISISLSSADVRNNVIYGNGVLRQSDNRDFGGGLLLYNATDVILINNTFSRNSTGSGGAIACLNSNPVIRNTIMWGDSARYEGPEIYYDSLSSPMLSYCAIPGFWDGEGNTSRTPWFMRPENGDFRLKSVACGGEFDSPLIDLGDPQIIDSLLDCSWGLGTEISDIGAYGGGDSILIGISQGSPLMPTVFSLSQNYPNPFNPTTTIQYDLPNTADVRLDIYDILGRKIETLINSRQDAGHHTAIWNANSNTSGIYFYKIQADDFSDTMKMLLLK
jgi:hypothetical protein